MMTLKLTQPVRCGVLSNNPQIQKLTGQTKYETSLGNRIRTYIKNTHKKTTQIPKSHSSLCEQEELQKAPRTPSLKEASCDLSTVPEGGRPITYIQTNGNQSDIQNKRQEGGVQNKVRDEKNW